MCRVLKQLNAVGFLSSVEQLMQNGSRREQKQMKCEETDGATIGNLQGCRSSVWQRSFLGSVSPLFFFFTAGGSEVLRNKYVS